MSVGASTTSSLPGFPSRSEADLYRLCSGTDLSVGRCGNTKSLATESAPLCSLKMIARNLNEIDSIDFSRGDSLDCRRPKHLTDEVRPHFRCHVMLPARFADG